MSERRSLPEEELNQFWNALMDDGHRPAAAPGTLDPGAAETLRWLARIGETPAPTVSRERVLRGIREQLGQPSAAGRDGNDPASAVEPVELIVHGPLDDEWSRSAGSPGNGRVRHAETNGHRPAIISLAPPRTARRFPLGVQAGALIRVAAAVILIVAMVGALAALIYPHRLRGERPTIAASDTAVLEQVLTEETTLLDLTLTDLPTYRAQVGLFLATLPPGTRSEQRSGAGPQLFYVAQGPVTVRVGVAPEPLEVIPPRSESVASPKILVAEGEQASIETGATLLAPGGAVYDLFTTGSTAVSVVDVLSAADAMRLGDGIDVQFASNGGMTTTISPPISIALRQGSLGPEMTIPAPTSGATRQVVASFEAASMGDLRSGTNGAVRNAGARPVDLYVLTVTTSEVVSLNPLG